METGSITYGAAHTRNDLEGILHLQKANLAQGLTPEEAREQGFVTVCHSFAQLKKMNEQEKHIIAKDEERVVGYCLAMTRLARRDIPVLISMFEVFDAITYRGGKISDYRYLVVGQVCVDKAYRGQGVLARCYAAYKARYQPAYDFAITIIDAANTRSLRAHQKLGFQDIHAYVDSRGTRWVVVLWDWMDKGE
jgi:GNAT superfamily N-acetyltransferase